MIAKEKLVNWCSWEGQEVMPRGTTCYWVFGKRPECSAYVADKCNPITGRCVYLVESLEELEE
jgi:hypothetical protein